MEHSDIDNKDHKSTFSVTSYSRRGGGGGGNLG